LVDVLVAVDVPRFDGEDDGPLDLSGIIRVTELVEQAGIIFDDSGGAPQLDPLLVGVPLLVWSGYAVLALLRHEHFYHGMPSSWWRWQYTLIRPKQVKGVNVETEYVKRAVALSGSAVGRVTDYIGISMNPSLPNFFNDPEAAPVLCDFIRDGDPDSRRMAAGICSQWRTYPEVVVPELIAVLKEDRPRKVFHILARQAAIGCLERYGPEAKAAVPLLLDCMNRNAKPSDGDAEDERSAAARALCQIEHDSMDLLIRMLEPDNVDLLIRMLEHPELQIWAGPGNSLGRQFGPKARAAVPALLKMYGSPDPHNKRAAALALLRIDPAAAHKAGVPKGFY
jgi:hypothetical protein